ncbi:MAG: hypothetical protein Tp1122DCM00d2C27307611_23 [Prokaryotic dsDNA virus sp.]|nr:MAG: hypothetical protein Tp1122DCM00d2C27307611_23 [Prokaryotic dsDNA virus sp.]|tara:strand:+ start:731 stop:2083 length:1353 start_codon:yes stop_codon:yes gene_type:complete
MIPNMSELTVLMSRWDINQQRKNKWKRSRYEALDYYNGDTIDYTSEYFSESTMSKIVAGNVNITKRIIDRVSLVYMQPPIRTYTNEDVVDYFVEKDLKLQRLERMTNLLDAVLLKPCWRIKDDGYGCIEYDIITDYEPMFGEDPLKPEAIVYPITMKSTVLDDTPEQFAYWDKESHFIFDRNGKKYTQEDNPDMVNPYGRLPFVECFRNGKPEFSYLDTNASNDLITSNLAINVAETNKNANVMFQSFGYLFVNGAGIDKDTMAIGQDKINYLGVDGSISIVSPPNAIPALDASITSSYKMLAQNYHLPTGFVEGNTQAESGVALRMRNIELTDDRKSDITRWRDIEFKLFDLERLIIAVEDGKDAGDLEDVDYSETVEVLSDKEQREKWDWELSKGLIDLADIMMQKNPDLTREEAQDYLFDRQATEVDDIEEQPSGNPLLDILNTPSE